MSAAKPRIPDSVSIMELAERMQKQGKVNLARPSAEEVRKKLTLDSLASGVGDPRVAVEAGADYPGFMRLRCEEVDLYDRNPRTSLNPRYTEIRDSIIERGGLQGPLTVTRRPGAKRYMLYMGGNTRLQIVRELWRTTREPRYEWINVTFHEWVNEADIIAAHLIENEARADTTFFEKAGGLAVLKDELERLRGTSLTLRELGVEAKRLGMKVSAVAAMNYLYAVAELSALGPLLTHENVNAIRTHAARHEKLISVLNLDPFAYRDAFRAIVDAAAARLVSSDEVSRTSALDGAQTQQLLDAMDRALARQADLDPGRIKDVLAEIASSGAGPSSARIREVAARADDEGADQADGAAAAVAPEQRGDGKANLAGGDSRQSQSPSRAAPAAPDPALAADPRRRQPSAAPAPAEDADRGFFDELLAYCGAFEIEALLCLHDAMPHGFYMEFPSDYFELLPADAAADPNLRRAAYLYLVALSRQLEPGVADRMPAASAWRKLVDKDPLDPSGSFETRYAQSCMGITGELGVYGLSAHDVAYLLCQPVGWQRLGALMCSYHRAFGASTNRYLDGEESAPHPGKRTMRTGVLARESRSPSDSKPTRKQRRSSSMVPIKDANIRRLLLEYLIAMIEEGDLQALLDEGIEPALLDALRHRSVRDLLRVAEMPLDLGLTLDSGALRVAFKRLDAIARDRRIVEYHIRHGAPPELMVRAFKLSGAELRAQREFLCGEFGARGRPQLPPEKVRDAVHAAWAEIAAEYDEKERFMILHQRFPDYTIGSLWHTIHEFDTAAGGASAGRKARLTRP